MRETLDSLQLPGNWPEYLVPRNGENETSAVLRHLIWFGLSPAPVITENSLFGSKYSPVMSFREFG